MSGPWFGTAAASIVAYGTNLPEGSGDPTTPPPHDAATRLTKGFGMEQGTHLEAGFPVDVHVLLHRGPRLLLLRRARTSPYAPGLLCLPSGKVEPGEDVVTAAVREVAEEIGVVLDPTMLRCDLVLHHRPPQGPLRIGWFFTAEGWPGARHPGEVDTVRNAEPHKHDELVWVDPDDLPDGLVAYTRVGLDAIRRGTTYALHLQQPRDSIHDDGHAARRLVAIRAGSVRRRDLL